MYEVSYFNFAFSRPKWSELTTCIQIWEKISAQQYLQISYVRFCMPYSEVSVGLNSKIFT